VRIPRLQVCEDANEGNLLSAKPEQAFAPRKLRARGCRCAWGRQRPGHV